MAQTVIKAEHLSKYYRLGVINNGTLFRDIQTWIALKRGKEDPHSKIGEHKYDGTADGFWALKDLNFERRGLSMFVPGSSPIPHSLFLLTFQKSQAEGRS